MAFRIGNRVLAGELRNTRRNGVFGWLEFAPDYGIRIELTGNLGGRLAGKHIRFKARQANRELTGDATDDSDLELLADRQIGVVGDMQLRQVNAPDLPIQDWLALDRAAQQERTSVKDSLYLEWYSQNGRVVAEIVDLEIEFVAEGNSETGGDSAGANPPDDGIYGVGFTEIRIDENGVAHTRNFELQDNDESDADEDPYGLFGKDLEDQVAESLGITESLGEQLEHVASEDDLDLIGSDADPVNEIIDEPDPRRPWDEVIPGIDEETKALYEQWDEIFDGKKDEPIAYLFETPLKLPRVEDVASDEEAEPLVRSILAQLALLNVALDMCEHFSYLETYRLLMNEILPTATVHPNLAASEMVLHYSTSDYCPQCTEEFDAEVDDTDDDLDNDLDSDSEA